jgi:hypothetical protein
MTEPELRKLYESAVGFEDRADAANDAARLKAYCESHTRCSRNHHRPLADIEKPCPICGSIVPFAITNYPEAA